MRAETTLAPICNETKVSQAFLLTELYFSDEEALLAGYIWGAISHAQVRSSTEISTRGYLSGYQIS